MSNNIPAGCAIPAIIIAIAAIPAWLTHVIVTIQSEEWVFLLAGAIFAPIGVIHGFGIWFGFW